jgi:hypothetical protein
MAQRGFASLLKDSMRFSYLLCSKCRRGCAWTGKDFGAPAITCRCFLFLFFIRILLCSTQRSLQAATQYEHESASRSRPFPHSLTHPFIFPSTLFFLTSLVLHSPTTLPMLSAELQSYPLVSLISTSGFRILSTGTQTYPNARRILIDSLSIVCQ